MRLPGTTPAAVDDDGRPDPQLAAALATGDAATVRPLLLTARLLLPVVALPGDTGEAEMAVPTLVAADARRALPAFTCTTALAAWRADARPVPMPGYRVFLGAVAEAYDAVVVDVAGPVTHAVEGVDLVAMGAAARALQTRPGAGVRGVGG